MAGAPRSTAPPPHLASPTSGASHPLCPSAQRGAKTTAVSGSVPGCATRTGGGSPIQLPSATPPLAGVLLPLAPPSPRAGRGGGCHKAGGQANRGGDEAAAPRRADTPPDKRPRAATGAPRSPAEGGVGHPRSPPLYSRRHPHVSLHPPPPPPGAHPPVATGHPAHPPRSRHLPAGDDTSVIESTPSKRRGGGGGRTTPPDRPTGTAPKRGGDAADRSRRKRSAAN